MSDTSVKVKDAVQELQFLNGELGRVKGVISSLEKEIEELEVQKATKHKEFTADSAAKSLQLEHLEKLINNRTESLVDLNSQIGSLELVLEDKRNELNESNQKIAKNVSDSEDINRLLGERRETAQVAEEKAKLAVKVLEEKQRLNDEREKGLDNKEASIVGTLKSLENDIEANKKLKLSLEKQINETDELKRTLEGKKLNVEFLERDLNDKLSKHKVQNDELLAVIERNNLKSKELDDREVNIEKEELEIAEQKSVLVNRETDLVLRERENRLKEKNLSLRERESKLE